MAQRKEGDMPNENQLFIFINFICITIHFIICLQKTK